MKGYTLFTVMFLLVTHTVAQFKNVKIDSAVLNNNLTNPSIAIVKKEGPVIAATAMDALYLSKDGGHSWEKSKVPGSGSDRTLISDGKGTLYLFQVIAAADGSHSQIHAYSKMAETFDGGGT